ncbi:MAG: dynamin family protein, partial [Burkholderiaceae bacterium]|nr:dynamin family protein [Burkholderiaceae bacterium]
MRRYGQWLNDSGLAEPALQARIERLLERLREDRISIAFVAEFSRGKSELINSIFFAEYGQRVLPSSAGRTTMCPTELMYDPGLPASVRLLPIETRSGDASVAELRSRRDAWHEIPVIPGDVDSVTSAFAAVRETSRVPVHEAVALGLYDADDDDSPIKPDAMGEVEIPRWRHAIANIPDPLLEMGLVVIDTPGLNAIGNEPELTLNLIPSADAVLFVLAADAGVTRTDIEVWRENISPSHKSGRFVVLNKIDGLWDELRDDVQIEIEIAEQVSSVSRTLDVPPERIFPVSAQKGLVAKIQGDRQLLRKSRLGDLERALSHDLIPQQQTLVREHIRRDFDELAGVVSSVVSARRRGVVEQLFELNGLRGKNRNVVDHMAARIKTERADFEKSLRHLQALRSVFARHSQSIYTAIGVDSLKRHVRVAREVMRASNFSSGLREGMSSLMAASRGDFQEVSRLVDEITTLMTAMYRTFNAEHGLSLGSPMVFSVRRYVSELERVETLYRRQFGALTLVTTEKWALMRRFFESVAARIKEIYDMANREIEAWLRSVMAPIEGQVREHQSQLRRRLDSVRRVLDASQSLDSRIAEIDDSRTQVEQQLAISSELSDQVRGVLDTTLVAAGELEP